MAFVLPDDLFADYQAKQLADEQSALDDADEQRRREEERERQRQADEDQRKAEAALAEVSRQRDAFAAEFQAESARTASFTAPPAEPEEAPAAAPPEIDQDLLDSLSHGVGGGRFGVSFYGRTGQNTSDSVPWEQHAAPDQEPFSEPPRPLEEPPLPWASSSPPEAPATMGEGPPPSAPPLDQPVPSNRPLADRDLGAGPSYFAGSPDLVPPQLSSGLSDGDAYAACGPAAAVAFARIMGRNPTLQEALNIARQVGWTQGGGMNGVGNEVSLLNSMQIPNRLSTTLDTGAIATDAASGNPVIVSTPNHYFVIDGYNPQNGQFHVGNSGTVYRTGAPWMSMDQIRQIGGGVNGTIFLDNPNSPRPSVAMDSWRGSDSGGGSSPGGGARPTGDADMGIGLDSPAPYGPPMPEPGPNLYREEEEQTRSRPWDSTPTGGFQSWGSGLGAVASGGLDSLPDRPRPAQTPEPEPFGPPWLTPDSSSTGDAEQGIGMGLRPQARSAPPAAEEPSVLQRSIDLLGSVVSRPEGPRWTPDPALAGEAVPYDQAAEPGMAERVAANQRPLPDQVLADTQIQPPHDYLAEAQADPNYIGGPLADLQARSRASGGLQSGLGGVARETLAPELDPSLPPDLAQAQLDARTRRNLVLTAPALVIGGPTEVAENAGGFVAGKIGAGLAEGFGADDSTAGMIDAAGNAAPVLRGVGSGALSLARHGPELIQGIERAISAIRTTMGDAATPVEDLPKLTQKLQGLTSLLEDFKSGAGDALGDLRRGGDEGAIGRLAGDLQEPGYNSIPTPGHLFNSKPADFNAADPAIQTTLAGLPSGATSAATQAKRAEMAEGGQRALDTFQNPTGETGGERVLRNLKTQLTDVTDPINAISHRVEVANTNFNGRGEAMQLVREEEIDPFLRTLGNDEQLKQAYDDYALLQRVQEIDALPGKGAKWKDRLYPNGIKPAEVPGLLADIRDEVGDRGMERIIAADNLAKEAFAKLVDEKIDEGMISVDWGNHLIESQSHYSPLKFAEHFSGGADSTLGRSVNVTGNGVRRLTEAGSEGDVLPATEAFINGIATGYLQVMRNHVVRTIGEDLMSLPQYKRLVKVEDLRQYPEGPLTKVSDKGGPITPTPRDLTAQIVTRQAGDKAGTISWMADGKRVALNVEAIPGLEAAVKALDAQSLGWWDRSLGWLNRGPKALFTTYSPSFILTANPISDTIMTYLKAPGAVAGIPEGFWEALTNSDRYKELIRGGMGSAGFGARDPRDIIQQVTRNGGIPINGPGDLAALARNPTEFLKRVAPDLLTALTGAGLEAAVTPADDENRGAHLLGGALVGVAGRHVLPKLGAAIEAAPRVARANQIERAGGTLAEQVFEGRRVTPDWLRAGEAMRHANAAIPFLNPWAQGSLQMVRIAKENPVGVGLRMAGLAAAAAGIYMWNRSPEMQDRYNDLQDWEKYGRLAVLLPFPAVKNDDGVGYKTNPHLSITVREAGLITGLVTYALESLDKQSPGDFGHFMSTWLGGQLPASGDISGAVVAPVKTLLEERSNHSAFTGRPIVNDNLEKLAPRERYDERSSTLSRSNVGRWLGENALSKALMAGDNRGAGPEQIDYALRSLGGTAAGQALDLADRAAGKDMSTSNIPVVGSLVRNYGGAIKQDRFENARQEMTQRSDTFEDRLHAEYPNFDQLPRREQLSLINRGESSIRRDVNLDAGLTERPAGQPPRFPGINDFRQERDIAQALTHEVDFKRNRKTVPPLTDVELGLVRRFRGRATPEYRKWAKEHNVQTTDEKYLLDNLLAPAP